ncbi:FHA domain-containing protein [Brotaphodocola sp.]|uniref:FHA domain-containing protein n=1 Tax=Brotaphodocola sp. TaxID=3073577 RepID=UPI003D7EF2FE
MDYYRYENKRILRQLPYLFCGLAGIVGIMKWIRIEIPFVTDFNGSYHIWQLLKLLKEVDGYIDDEDLKIISIIVSIPLVFWACGVLSAVVGAIIDAGKNFAKKVSVFAIISSGCMMISGFSYLIMVYWVKNKINETMREEIGIAIGGGLIKVPIWPWLMLIFGILGIVAVVLAQNHTTLQKFTKDQIDNKERQESVKKQTLGKFPGIIVLHDLNHPDQLYGGELGKPVIVGREAGCEIVIKGDTTVSRQHCKIFRSATTCYVEDLNSYNHTYVNGVMITKAVVLKKGDTLKIGNTKLVVEECKMDAQF